VGELVECCRVVVGVVTGYNGGYLKGTFRVVGGFDGSLQILWEGWRGVGCGLPRLLKYRSFERY
jgi:hypothetical protein